MTHVRIRLRQDALIAWPNVSVSITFRKSSFVGQSPDFTTHTLSSWMLFLFIAKITTEVLLLSTAAHIGLVVLCNHVSMFQIWSPYSAHFSKLGWKTAHWNWSFVYMLGCFRFQMFPWRGERSAGPSVGFHAKMTIMDKNVPVVWLIASVSICVLF